MSMISAKVLFTKILESISSIQTRITPKLYTATCTTGASTAAKVATLDDADGFSLTAGVRVAVTFQYGNSATTPTLRVDGTTTGTAKTIAIPSSATAFTTGVGTTYNTWGAYETIVFTYTGTYWSHAPSGRLGYLLAPKASPTFTGTPAAPTATAGTSTTQIATTEFVQTATANAVADIGTVPTAATNASAVSIASNTGASCNTTITSLTLPSAGTWLLIGAGHFTTNTSGVRRLDIVSSSTATTYEVSYPAGDAQLKYQVTKIVTPSTAATYYLRAGQNSGSELSCAANNGTLSAVRIK